MMEEDDHKLSVSPSVENQTNRYRFELHADSLTSEISDTLNFTSDQLILPLTVVNYTSGSANFRILDQNEQPIVQEPLNQNRIVTLTQIPARTPRFIRFEFSDYSGNISLVLKGN
ncbi:MAG: hypothetical protein GF313_07535 [Caldithrix sp.]|nr:hypothetical protein [Caldithrix sp.]